MKYMFRLHRIFISHRVYMLFIRFCLLNSSHAGQFRIVHQVPNATTTTSVSGSDARVSTPLGLQQYQIGIGSSGKK